MVRHAYTYIFRKKLFLQLHVYLTSSILIYKKYLIYNVQELKCYNEVIYNIIWQEWLLSCSYVLEILCVNISLSTCSQWVARCVAMSVYYIMMEML